MPQTQLETTQHELAISRIANLIREAPDTSGGVQLRRFLWSLYNLHHMVNLWDFASRVSGDLAEPVADIIRAALAGDLQELDVKRGLMIAGEIPRWDTEPSPGTALEELQNAQSSLTRAIRSIPPSYTHTELVRVAREIEHRIAEVRLSVSE